MEPVQRTSSSVTLEWHYNEDNAAQPAFITGYFVTVQEVRSDKLSGHVIGECTMNFLLLEILCLRKNTPTIINLLLTFEL